MTRTHFSLLTATVCAAALIATPAHAETFESGSLIIPMDIDYQDNGMFEAYGLVYELLRQDIPVHWVIKDAKPFEGIDFTASGVDHQTGDPIDGHGYRGGPWVIDAAHADAALAIIDGWQETSPDVAVHEATATFEGDVAHTLIHAPTIAMMADGNQKIAREYMEAARIPDSIGDYTWPDDSPDMLDPDEVAGPSEASHEDGALFDEDGDPVYCQFMSMHWGIGDAEDNPEVVAEVRSFLGHPTHFFAECQAVNAFENLDPHGFYLTESGFLIGDQPDQYDYFQTDTPFGQFDGVFESVGGSEPAYSLPDGANYKSSDIVMITEKGTPEGVNDVWMTGFLDGVCPASSQGCLSAGKVSYLGGHSYKVDLPISQNPDSQGTRLFLNSLFEAPCGTTEGAPKLTLEKAGPSFTDEPQVTYTLEYNNSGPFTALDVVLVDSLPAGATYISGTQGAMLDGDSVRWDLGNLGVGEGGTMELTVEFPEYGVYTNLARLDYLVGVNIKTQASNEVVTEYADMPSTTSGPTDSETDTAGPTTDGGSDSDGITDGTAGTSETAGEAGTVGTAGTAGTAGSDGGSLTDTGGEDNPGGCACRAGPSAPLGWALFGVPVLLLRRRRASA